jgi:hypothetical protein
MVSGMPETELMAYARACWPDGSAAEHRLLALQIAIIIAVDDTLERSPPLETPHDEYRTFLPWHRPNGDQVTAARAAVRNAVSRLDTGLARRGLQVGSAASASRGPVSWWRRQAEAVIGAAWQEARWRTSAPPDEATYLAVSEHSIGVGWLAASLIRLGGCPIAPAAGSRLHAATGAVAVAVRAANDLQDLERERREGKVQLLFLRARALERLGVSPAEAERRAMTQLETELADRVARASALLNPSGWADSERLRKGLEGMLGAAMALYARAPSRMPVTAAGPLARG